MPTRRPFRPARTLVATLLLLSLAPVARLDAAVKRMFVTSLAGPGNLGSWPLLAGQGLSGIAAGDAICQTLAGDAGLQHPEAFRALLGTTTQDPYCRIRGGSGLLADSCGVDPIVLAFTSAGPWLRTDDFPFSPREPVLMSQGAVYSPPVYDENGDALVTDFNTGAWTGSNPDGTTAADTCNNWTSGAGSDHGATGDVTRTTVGWINRPTICSFPSHLYCFESGTNGDPLPPFEQPGALAFVTFQVGTGDLSTWQGAQGSGLAAGDAICQSAATAGGLPSPGSFRAFLSTTAVDAVDRLVVDGPWKRPDGVQVAASKADLADGTLFSTISQSESGAYLATAVWTGSDDDGTYYPAGSCDEWTSGDAAANGLYGLSHETDDTWVSLAYHACNLAKSLYCLSDVITVFWDGFEGGSSSRWSYRVP
jgi:hypothetical protein